jgi:hypothetical protein
VHISIQSEDPKYICLKCGERLRRLARRGFLENGIFPFFGYFPWECLSCRNKRMLRARGRRAFRPIWDSSLEEMPELQETAKEEPSGTPESESSQLQAKGPEPPLPESSAPAKNQAEGQIESPPTGEALPQALALIEVSVAAQLVELDFPICECPDPLEAKEPQTSQLELTILEVASDLPALETVVDSSGDFWVPRQSVVSSISAEAAALELPEEESAHFRRAESREPSQLEISVTTQAATPDPPEAGPVQFLKVELPEPPPLFSSLFLKRESSPSWRRAASRRQTMLPPVSEAAIQRAIFLADSLPETAHLQVAPPSGA